jgi:HAD superfamily hydrolase (TIGR01509 family)
LKAVIFDLDGVLVDSEPFHAETLLSLAGELEIPLSLEDTRRFIGVSDEEMWSILIHEHRLGGDLSAKVLAERQAQRSLDRLSVKPLSPRDGVPELLTELRSLGVATGVASSSATAYVDRVLSTAGLSLYFNVRVAGDQVQNCKPDPEPYRTALERMGIPAGWAAAIEDSPPGIESAKRAGLFCFALKTSGSQAEGVLKPDVVIKDFSQRERSRILYLLDSERVPDGIFQRRVKAHKS